MDATTPTIAGVPIEDMPTLIGLILIVILCAYAMVKIILGVNAMNPPDKDKEDR